MILVLLMGIASVSASDNESIIQATDESSDTVSVTNQTLTDTESNELSTSQTDSLRVANEDESYGSSDNDVLTAADGTFTDLYNKVKNGGTVTLDRNYVYTASTDSAYVEGVIIDKTTTINGNGYTLNGNNAARIFQITATTVVLNNITFINGKTTGKGGAISWSGTNGEVKNSVFRDNTATSSGNAGGAIYWTGTGGKITNSNFFNNNAPGSSGDGGAVMLLTSGMTVDNCWFDGNKAEYDTGSDSPGVSIWGANNIIKNSNFTNNRGGYNGAVLIYTNGDYNKIINCIFENNTSKTLGGALRIEQNNNEITNCTFINNKATTDGGAIYLSNVGGTRHDNTISGCEFINNTAGNNGGAISNAGQTSMTITSSKFEGNSANNGDAVYNTGTSTVIDDCAFFVDEGKTVNDYVSSTTSITITDTKYGKLYVSPTGTGTGLTANSPTNWNNAYNLIADDGEIILQQGTYNIVNFVIDKSITITGQGNVIIDAQKNGRIFTVSASDVTIDHVTLKNGLITATGGAIYWTGADGTLINSNIMSNTVSNGKGGAIYWSGRNGLLSDNYFYDNKATQAASTVGGAIYITGVNSKITHSTFENNHVYGSSADGGGIATQGNYIEINSCLFLDNTASNDSGACTIWGQYNKVINCTFRNNKGTHNGALLLYNNHNIVSNCTFINNTCSGPGGAFRCDYTNCTLTDSIFINNTATTNGGAVFWTGTQGSVSGCEFINNSANYGGAISTGSYDSHLANNLNIDNCEFEENTATTNGGAIYNDANNVVVSDSTFNGNTAPTNNDISSTKDVTTTELTFDADLTINVNDVIVGESLTITGTLSAAKAGAIIDIKDKGTKIGTVTVNNNQFTYTLTAPSLGTHTISLATTDDSGNTYVYNTNSFSFRTVPVDSYSALQILINRATAASTLALARTYSYNSAYDTALVGGVKVNKSLTIKGAGYSIDGKNAARALEVSANSVTIENTKFINGKSTANGGAIYWTGTGGKINSSTFESNTASSGNNLYATNKVTVTNSNFANDFSLTKTGNINYGTNEVIGGTFASNAPTTMYSYLNGENKGSGSVSSNKFSISLSLVPVGTYTITLKDENSNTYTFSDNSFTVNRLGTVYISPSGTGSGNSASSPTTWDKVADIISPTGTVVFANGIYSNFYGKTINQGWTLQAASGATPVLDANNNGIIFAVSANNVKINGLTFKNGKVTDGYGSAIHWTGTGGSLSNSVLTENTGRPVSATATLSMTNNQLKDQITLTKSDIDWAGTETITGIFAHNAPSTVNILFNGTSQGSYSVASSKVTASYAFTNPSTRSVGSYVVSLTEINNFQVILWSLNQIWSY